MGLDGQTENGYDFFSCTQECITKSIAINKDKWQKTLFYVSFWVQKPSAILVTPISTPVKDLGSQVPDTFPTFQLPNTGIDPKLTEIKSQHFC